LAVELEHLKIETRLINATFANAMGVYVTHPTILGGEKKLKGGWRKKWVEKEDEGKEEVRTQ